jgi:hypothetical protein
MTTPEFSSQEGRARSRGTRGNIGAHLIKEVRSGAEGHVAAPELTSARRRGPELRDTWRRRSFPQQEGEVQSRETRGGSGAHLCMEVWSKVITYVAVRGCTPYFLS